MKFSELSAFLQKINDTRRSSETEKPVPVYQQRKVLIEDFITNWRRHEKTDFYKVLRLVLPDRDKMRMYHIKETTLASIIAQSYGISKASDEYKRLFAGQSYGGRNARFHKYQRMSEMMAGIIAMRQPNVSGSVYDIESIDAILNELSNSRESHGERKTILSRAFAQMSRLELKHFILIIIKAKIIGHSETSFLRSWHPDAPEYFAVVSSLEAICRKLQNPHLRLNSQELSVQVMMPFAPQLAAQPKRNYEHLAQSFANSFYIEEKLDGERLQLHVSRVQNSDQFVTKFYSRKATDYTSVYGENLDTGTLAPYLKQTIDARRLAKINKLIFDGEVLSYDTKRQVVLPLGTLKPTNVEAMFRESEPVFRPMYVIFDLLLINDRNLCDEPLVNRRKLLKQLVSEKKTYIEIIKEFEGSTGNDIQVALRKAVETNSEGIIVKDKRSKYKIGERNNSWVKVKPEYLQEFGSDLDLCVIGRLPKKKTTYICGLRVGNSDTFQSFCGIANGISMSDYEKISLLTDGKWRNFETDPPPEDLLQFSSKKPSEWIHPRESVVLQIKARDIEYGAFSKEYKVGITLLSGYMKQIREDKDWSTSLSLEEFLAWKHRFRGENGDVGHKLESKVVKGYKRLKLQENDEHVSVSSSLFQDYVFYILSDFRDSEKRYEVEEIKALIKRNGGIITNNEKTKLSKNGKMVLLSNKNTRKTQILAELGYDIVRHNWVLDCAEFGEIFNLEPRYCFAVSPEVARNFDSRVDSFGDSYEVPLRRSYLQEIVGNCEVEIPISTDREFAKMAEFSGLECDRVFWDIKFMVLSVKDIVPESYRDFFVFKKYCDQVFIRDVEIFAIKNEMIENGGTIVEAIEECDYVVICGAKKAEDELALGFEIKQILQQYKRSLLVELQTIRKTISHFDKIPRIVNEKFIEASIKESSIVPAERFVVTH